MPHGADARQRPAHPDRRLPRDAAPDARGRRRGPAARAQRLPLDAGRTPDGSGLRMPRGPALPGVRLRRCCARAAGAGATGCALLRRPLRWQRDGFRAMPGVDTVAAAVRRAARRACARDLIEPLCVAALNTPAVAGQRARCSCACCAMRCSPAPGGADLLLPRVGLGALLPGAGARAGCERTARRCGSPQRVRAIERARRPAGASTASRSIAWSLACQRGRSGAAARRRIDADWARGAAALDLRADRHRLPARSAGAACREPMLALRSERRAPGAVRLRPRPARRPDGPAGLRRQRRARLAGARRRRHERGGAGAGDAARCRSRCARRSRCCARSSRSAPPSPARPGSTAADAVAPGLLACGDYVDGPYPATLEGAVRSGACAPQRV